MLSEKYYLNGFIFIQCLIGLIFISLHADAQQATAITRVLSFSGKVGHYPVAFQLREVIGKDSISGEYYYMSKGRDNSLMIEGNIPGDGKLQLQEKAIVQQPQGNAWKTTGRFSLTQTKAGLTGEWQSADGNRKLPVSLTMLNNMDGIIADIITPNIYANPKASGADEYGRYKINRIDVTPSNGEKYVLKGFDELLYGKPEMELEDLNFDGYLDLKVPVYYPNRSADLGYLYFLYHPRKKQLIVNETLQGLDGLLFDPFKKEVYQYDSNSGEKIIFKWHEDGVTLIR